MVSKQGVGACLGVSRQGEQRGGILLEGGEIRGSSFHFYRYFLDTFFKLQRQTNEPNAENISKMSFPGSS